MDEPHGLYHRLDISITDWMARYGINILRISTGVIFFWFGLLKFFPGYSQDHDLAVRTIGLMSFKVIPPETAILIAASCECIIGIGLSLGLYMRAILLLLFMHMLCALIPLAAFHQEMFSRSFVPTLLGQYVIKNVILFSAGLVIGATVRGGAVVAEPDLYKITRNLQGNYKSDEATAW